MTPVESDDVREFLIKSWMTHDGMWFRHCLESCGIEKTNQINKAAIYAAGRIEAKRLAQLLGVENIKSFAALYDFIRRAFEVVQAEFMVFSCEARQPDVLRWEMHRCFAYDGVKRLGVIDRYQCGIFERVRGWLDGLGIAYTIMPQVEGCMMYTDGHCYREFHFSF